MTEPTDHLANSSSVGANLAGVGATTKLAVDRTKLAYERTMMAWLRTSTSLISFGFSIQKFFQIESNGNGQYDGLLGPSNFGRLMVLAGLVVLVLATLEHRRDVEALRKEYPFIPSSMARAIAAVVAVLGIFAMISVMIRS
jgi:putative membrane protein